MKVKSEREVAQSCPTLTDPMDCSPPGSSVHGIFQARVLEWGAIASSLTTGQTSAILALSRKFQAPQQISQPGLKTPREFDFGGQWDLITELTQNWGNRLLEGTTKTFCTLGTQE